MALPLEQRLLEYASDLSGVRNGRPAVATTPLALAEELHYVQNECVLDIYEAVVDLIRQLRAGDSDVAVIEREFERIKQARRRQISVPTSSDNRPGDAYLRAFCSAYK